MSDLAAFLLARITEDEEAARAAVRWSEGAAEWGDAGDPDWEHIAAWDPARVLAECEAKRRIVEREARRRRIKDVVIASSHSTSDAWVSVTTAEGETERLLYTEFEQRFTEPADSDILRDLALPYADHPDYLEEWRP